MTALGTDLKAPIAWRRAFAPEVVVAGKYKIEHVVGERDITLVLAATRRDLDQRVVLRVLHPELAARAPLARSFKGEMRRAASLKSDYALRFLDVARLPTGEPFVVTEWVDELDIRSARGAPIFRAVELIAEAAHAVAEAHARGWVHGEISPRNLLLAKRSRGEPIVKVSGFGMATVHAEIDRLDRAPTPARIVKGESLYCAPEQLDPDHPVDTRADVFALGTIFYELVTGRPAFGGDGLAETLRAIERDAIAPPSSTRRGVSAAVDDIVARCLAKNPDERFAHAGELLEALDELLAESHLTKVSEPDVFDSLEGNDADAETEIRPFLGEATVDDTGVRLSTGDSVALLPRGRSVNRTTHDGRARALPRAFDESSEVPSFVTGSDPSSRAMIVREHPLGALRNGRFRDGRHIHRRRRQRGTSRAVIAGLLALALALALALVLTLKLRF
jgi:serine/threonine protein kinase